MTIVIFGANGQLGQAYSTGFKEAVVYSKDDIDITDAAKVEGALRNITTPVVINTAAYTNVELAESEVNSAFLVNAVGPTHLAKAVQQAGGIMVQISTDYVFDGVKETYLESDTPFPLNVYGLSKWAGEAAVATYCRQHYILRTSALFGRNPKKGDSNFVSKRIEQLQRSAPIQMVADQWTVPTCTTDVVDITKQLLTTNAPFGIYHAVNSGGPVTWFDFTKEIAQIAGYASEITAVSTAGSNSQLRRPTRSVLKDTKLAAIGITVPNWRESLRVYIHEKVS